MYSTRLGDNCVVERFENVIVLIPDFQTQPARETPKTVHIACTVKRFSNAVSLVA